MVSLMAFWPTEAMLAKTLPCDHSPALAQCGRKPCGRKPMLGQHRLRQPCWANIASASQKHRQMCLHWANIGPTMLMSVSPMLAQQWVIAGLWQQANVEPTSPPSAKKTLAQRWHANVGPTNVLTLGQRWPNHLL